MTHIQQRRDTSTNWAATNPVLLLGEVGWETNTLRAKLGDGVTAWNDLDYATMTPTDLSGYAPLASPAFTGNPTAPTPTVSDDDNSIATTEFVKNQGYATLDSPALTGNPTAPTPSASDDDTSIATTGFVKDQEYAPLASPALTGNPTAPTPATSDDDTSIATTGFVKNALWGFYEVAPLSAEFTVTSSSAADVTGWTIPFEVENATDVFEVVVSLDAQVPAATTFAAQPRIDGLAVTPTQGEIVAVIATVTRQPLTKVYKVSGLAVGAHTLGVSAYRLGSNVTLYSSHSVISIKRVPMYVPDP